MHRQAEPHDLDAQGDRPAGVGASPRRGGSPTLVDLRSAPARVAEGEQLELSAQVRTVEPTGATATGRVVFLSDGRRLGDAALDVSGHAVLSGVLLDPGLHAVTAVYAGDAEHAAAASRALPQAVTASAAAVVVLVPAPRAVTGGTLLEAELVDTRTGRLAEDAEGPLVFHVGTDVVAVAGLRRGHARVVVPALPEGALRVVFDGDTEHAPAVGRPA